MASLVDTVIGLEKTPEYWVSYRTISSLHSPGIVGAFLKFGIVQPQVLWASLMMSGSEPVFLNLNLRYGSDPFSTTPKSISVFSKVIIGPVEF